MKILRARWLEHRRRLHAAFLAACEPPDASWLAEMGGSPRAWRADEVAALWAAAPRLPEARSHAYLHVPFCKSICRFCNYERLRPSHPRQLAAWAAQVIASAEALAPALAGLTFHTLYVGGGTPSVLPPPLLREVIGALERCVPLHPRASRYVEMDPAVMTPPRLRAWRGLGFSHISFGIQTLDPHVNTAHARGPQDRALVARRFAELRAAGVSDVSCDFLLGLAGTTAAGILAEIQEVLREHRPRWVDVYQITPTDAYVGSHFGGSRERFWAHLRPFQAAAPAGLARIAAEEGYDLAAGQDHRYTLQQRSPAGARPKDDPARGFRYSQLPSDQQRPLHLLGLGPSARSRIFGQARLICEEAPGGGPARWVGERLDLAEEAAGYLIYALRDGDAVSRAGFARIFGADVASLLPAAVAAWEAAGIARLSSESLTLRAADRRQRAADLLWLVPDERLEQPLARALGVGLDPPRLWERLAPLRVGSDVAGWTLAGVGEGRIYLRDAAGELALRVRPPLAAGEGLTLAAEEPPGEGRPLRRAAALLERLLNRSVTPVTSLQM